MERRSMWYQDNMQFGAFKIALAEQLTNDVNQKLSLIFGYPPQVVEKITTSGGVSMVMYMEERAQISEKDILPLLNALKKLGLHGLVAKVEQLHNTNLLSSAKQLPTEEMTLRCLEINTHVERTGNVESIRGDIIDLCSRNIEMYTHHSKLMKRSTIYMLEIASSNQIPISEVTVGGFSSVDVNTGSLILQAVLLLPVLDTLKALTLSEVGREMSVTEVADLLGYAARCRNLKALRFWRCLLPFSIPAAQTDLNILRKRNVEVRMFINDYGRIYQVGLRSGCWEREDGKNVTDEEYRSEVERFRDDHRLSPWQLIQRVTNVDTVD